MSEDDLRTASFVVLYRTPHEWRFSVGFTDPESLACGALPDPAPDSAVESAQLALQHLLETVTGRQAHISWEPSDRPDWWHGTVA